MKIYSDLRTLQTITPRIRVYSLTNCDVRSVLKAARRYNVTVWLGMWVGKKTSLFETEFKMLSKLVDDKLIDAQFITGINVGSETVYRGDATVDTLVENTKRVKQLLNDNTLKIPVSITETMDGLIKNPELVNVSDVVSVNQFPFWSKVPIEDAIDDLKKSLNNIQGFIGNKTLVITETGWATGGFDRNASRATPASAVKYLNDFFLLAQQYKWDYYYFSGFDTPFRSEQDGVADSVEDYFGIFKESGTMKKEFAALVINGTTFPDGNVSRPLNVSLKPTGTPEVTSGAQTLLHRWMSWAVAGMTMATVLAL